MLRRIVSATRFLMLVAVLASLLLAVCLLVFGGLETGRLIMMLLAPNGGAPPNVKTVALSAIKVVDLLLLGTVCYLVALGLYALFIDQLPLPAWLEIHTLDDLKRKLISVLIVVVSVFFLEHVVAWDGERNLLLIGIPIALLIGALTYYLGHGG